MRPLTSAEFQFPEFVLHQMKDAVVALDGELRITFWNDAATRLYGFERGEVLGRLFKSIIVCPGAQLGVTDADEALCNIGLGHGRFLHTSRLGREIPVDVTLVGMGRATQTCRYIAIIHDLTGYQRLESSLNDQLEFERLLTDLSACFNNLPEDEIDAQIEIWLGKLVDVLRVDRGAFTELTPEGRMQVTHAYAVCGIAPYPKEIADDRLPWLVTEMRQRRMVSFSRIEDLPAAASTELEYCRAAGIRSFIGIPIDIGNSLICVLTFSSCRQEREWPAETMSRLRLAGDVFANAIVRRQAKQRLEQKLNELAHFGRVGAMAELAAVIAHELDQPLTAVVSNAEAVRYMIETGEIDRGEADEALKDVIDAGMRASDIVRRERRLLRKSSSEIVNTDVNELVRDIEVFIKAEARHDGIKVILELLPDLPEVTADPVQLQQVVLNLARNGLHAMREVERQSRMLQLRTAASGDEVVLTVSDAGPPVSDALMAQMFEPFYSTKPSGLGMGLAISKSIVEAYRGRIWATRNADAGLTMTVALPRSGHASHAQ